MIGGPFNKSNRARLVVFGVTGVVAVLVVHSICARVYYRLNSVELAIAAEMAVRAGANYLPENPSAAVWTADAYARRYGARTGEVALTRTTSDNLTLTIRLCRKMPWYMVLLVVGVPPDHEIVVTASCRKKVHPPARPQIMI